MIKDTFFSLPRFIHLCRKEMVENWKSNVLRAVLMYGVLAVVMVWDGYFQYIRTHHYQEDPAWAFLLLTFCWALLGFGCLSASFMMEKMKTKTSRTSMLMIPATPFEKFFSRWLICTIVYLVVFLICYRLADYTRFMIYSLAYPEKDFIAPVALSHLVGDEDYYTLCENGLEFGALISSYFFVQSLFILGSSIWPKHSFLKTFASGTVIGIIYFFVGVLTWEMLSVEGYFYSGGIFDSKEDILRGIIVAGILCALMNWTLAYFRFKESEIINRM